MNLESKKKKKKQKRPDDRNDKTHQWTSQKLPTPPPIKQGLKGKKATRLLPSILEAARHLLSSKTGVPG